MQRFATTAAAVLVAGSAFAAVSVPKASSAQASPASTFPPCYPMPGSRVLKDPPLWVPTDANNHTITLHVRQTGIADFCYVVDGQKSYYEAPTIQVHQGETFTLILKNELPIVMNMTRRTSTPEPAPTAADGCDQMETAPIPKDNSSGVLWTTPPPDPRLQADMEMNNTSDTNIHTHGWDVSPAVDNVFKSTTASKSTRGGARSCVYAFAVPASQTAGSYWYHAHMHGVSNAQVGGGLAGALIVLPKSGPATVSRVLLIKNLTTPPSVAPKPLFLQAGRLPGGSLTATAGGAASSPTFPPPGRPGTVWSGISFKETGGPCGWGPPGSSPAPKPPSNPLMVNGVSIPPPGSSTPPATLLVPQTERLRVINASANSYVYLMMFAKGSTVPENLEVVARDGVDLDNTAGEALPLLFNKLLLGPGNRADLLVSPSAVQRTLISRFTCTGALGLSDPTQSIATIPARPVTNRMLAAPPVHVLAPGQTKAAAFVAKYASKVIRQREITFTQYDGFKHFYVTDTSQKGYGERPFWLQRSATPNDPDHYMLPNITVTQDDTEIWTLVNAAAEIHAFHIHQMTFKTISTDDPELMSQFRNVLLDVVPLAPAKPVPGLVWTDPAGDPFPALTPTHTKILINFGVVHPGTFVYHCHMLAHEDSGMMGIITVLPRRTAAK